MKAYNSLQDKVIDVTKEGDHYVDQDGCMWDEDELYLFQEPDWKQVRIQASIAAMQTVDDHVSTVEELARRCVRYADAFVEELKKGGQDAD